MELHASLRRNWFSFCTAGLVLILGAAPSARAQRGVPAGTPPDVSDKALITKATPVPKKDPQRAATSGGPVKQYSIEQFMATTRVGGASFSPDEKSLLFHSNKTGIFNVYRVPATG